MTFSWKLEDNPCISLIGMAGAGKSTLGQLLAERLGWVHMDTDRLIEAWWGDELQHLLDTLGVDSFLAAEEEVVASLGLKRCVIATGGSVVYGARAVKRLKSLGPVGFLRIDLPTFLARVGPATNRGFVRRPGCANLEDVFHERQPLYEAAADFTIRTDDRSLEDSLEEILRRLQR